MWLNLPFCRFNKQAASVECTLEGREDFKHCFTDVECPGTVFLVAAGAKAFVLSSRILAARQFLDPVNAQTGQL